MVRSLDDRTFQLRLEPLETLGRPLALMHDGPGTARRWTLLTNPKSYPTSDQGCSIDPGGSQRQAGNQTLERWFLAVSTPIFVTEY